MKRSVTPCFFMSFIFLMLLSSSAFSQTLKDFFNSSETTALYLGIDFTQARLIDDPATSEIDVRDRQYAGINDLMLSEAKKYDVNGAFHRTNIDHDISMVASRNVKVDAARIKSTTSADFHRLKEDDINALVKGFDFGDKKGLGILFVMEAMSKSGKAAAIWVTFIDMKAKKVLLTERMEEKTKGGFSFRNLWASSIKNLLDDIEGDMYKKWKAKYP